jgi:hypothetical protein
VSRIRQLFLANLGKPNVVIEDSPDEHTTRPLSSDGLASGGQSLSQLRLCIPGYETDSKSRTAGNVGPSANLQAVDPPQGPCGNRSNPLAYGQTGPLLDSGKNYSTGFQASSGLIVAVALVTSAVFSPDPFRIQLGPDW